MAKRLFFLSLIILSAAMGFNWWKERAKAVKKPKIKIQKPVDINETENGSDTAIASGGAETASGTASGTGAPGDASGTAVASGSESASGSAAVASGTASSTAPVKNQDPVLAGWETLPRNPFERSVYFKMMEEAGKAQKNTGEVSTLNKRKTFKVLGAPWSASIETDSDLMAIIGGRYYKTGDAYEDKTILKIGTDVITMEDASSVYRIPKKGMTINLASDGNYSIAEDKYKKY